MVYRTVGNIDRALEGVTASDAILKALEEYAIESSILKIVGSESLSFVADEAVQIFGGNGFSAEYPADRTYRDARINRIFEGTNEINRLLVPTMLLRRAAREDVGIAGAAEALLAARGAAGEPDDAALLRGVKLCARGAIDLARRRFGDGLAQEQEVVLALADLVIDAYAAECAMARAAQAAADGADAASAADMARATLHDAAARVEQRAGTLAGSLVADASAAEACRAAVRAACARPAIDRIAIDRRIATRVLA